MPPKAKHKNVLIKVDRHVVQMVGEYSETKITQLNRNVWQFCLWAVLINNFLFCGVHSSDGNGISFYCTESLESIH